ncbi:MAG: bifunctional non-ous end joining protein LigD [Actinomycetota bacterium]|jgi:bifunctional non-homologous end joining protein LigD|nr:bifunctional non-ous end joining protein LigD [Actinomycetota bacterium]
MADKLTAYRKKRDQKRTPEPVPPKKPLPKGNDDTFVIQEHHARRLHWDFRLERDGVLVSWALPRGVPDDPKRNHLAVHTEDHPLEYASFAGEIPKGEYGGGSVTIWDRGTYECEKWSDSEVKVVLHGSKAQGRYALFRTGGDQWMIHRMDPPAHPEADPMPELVRPMLATAGALPPADQEHRWAFEMKWDGVRAVVYVDHGTVRVVTRNDREVVSTYPELRGLAEFFGDRTVVLDGEIVAFDEKGRPSFGTLQQRMHVQRPTASLLDRVPVTYLAFDLIYLAGTSLISKSYDERRAALEGLGLDAPRWTTPPAFEGDGSAALAASEAQGLEGVVAKRRDSVYEPGRRGAAWIKAKHVRMQEVVIGGWKEGEGRRAGGIGSLLIGVHDEEGRLLFAGHVGTGFTARMLDDLAATLRKLERKTSPFDDEVPRSHAKDAHWVTPKLVGEVVFTEWTGTNRLRHPAWRGLRPDKDPADVVREP